MAICASLTFFGTPLALVGTPYIIIAAYAVRSLPASVRGRRGRRLQQIDPSIEEASTSLGADSQYTFRNVTLPLILPAFIAGLIFAFARHMTSLSAVIFLTTRRMADPDRLDPERGGAGRHVDGRGLLDDPDLHRAHRYRVDVLVARSAVRGQ